MAHSVSIYRVSPAPKSFMGKILSWYDVAQQRQALARLDKDALADIGLTAEQAQEEANRPFWV